MPTQALMRRLDGLRTVAMATRGGGIVIVYPDDWPEGVWAAFEAARRMGDRALQADILSAQTGRHVAFSPEDVGVGLPNAPLQLIVIRARRDGPR